MVSTQQTRDVKPMLVLCWDSLVDDVPTSKQHWFNVPCLLGLWLLVNSDVNQMLLYSWPIVCDAGPAIKQHCRAVACGEGGGGKGVSRPPWNFLYIYILVKWFILSQYWQIPRPPPPPTAPLGFAPGYGLHRLNILCLLGKQGWSTSCCSCPVK